ncbi:glutathione S-transferase family protein [Jannaschia sp. LMIT008]|uniref:glutathione S-transferase family protein n=1 Tax=Jannaschia maritima TaxID=3032585 RepID=UPI0028116E44|nr:glutathione S-transferase C-terminal domain-containing protein [Jannaschia sp. LMIT008]
MTPVLHDWVLDAGCYRVRLLASLLGADLDLRSVDVHPGDALRSEAFLLLNPAGTLPVMEVDGSVLTDGPACLTWLAATHDAGWLGDPSPGGRAALQHWLGVSHELAATLGAARPMDMLGASGDPRPLRLAGRGHLRRLDAALARGRWDGRAFLLGDRPTIADVACFPDVALAGDCGMSLDPYPSIRLWMRAVRGLPGFVPMPGIHPLHEASPFPEDARGSGADAARGTAA